MVRGGGTSIAAGAAPDRRAVLQWNDAAFYPAPDAATPEDLTGFFTEWLDQTDRPEPTKANGVPQR